MSTDDITPAVDEATLAELVDGLSRLLDKFGDAYAAAQIEQTDPSDARRDEASDAILAEFERLAAALRSAWAERDQAQAELERLRIGGHTRPDGHLIGCAEANEAINQAQARIEYLTRDRDFWQDQQKFAANVAATITDLDEEAPALRKLLAAERDRRKKVEAELDRWVGRFDKAIGSVTAQRDKALEALDEIRQGAWNRTEYILHAQDAVRRARRILRGQSEELADADLSALCVCEMPVGAPCPAHPDVPAVSEPTAGGFWERAVIRRFVMGGHVDPVTIRAQVAAMLDELERAPAASESVCGSCGGDRWVDDENWQPEQWELQRGRIPGSGRIPCGLCNHGGWNVPDGDASSEEA